MRAGSCIQHFLARGGPVQFVARISSFVAGRIRSIKIASYASRDALSTPRLTQHSHIVTEVMDTSPTLQ